MRLIEQRFPAAFGETVIYSALPESQTAPHPWSVEMVWDGSRWLALVSPGFVNYEVALVPMAPAEITRQKLPAVNGEAELWDSPMIPLDGWRDVGGEEDAGPAFFAALGVRGAGADLTIVDESVRVDVTQRPSGAGLPPRALRAIDFYVEAARASYSAHLVLGDPTATGESVDLGVSYDTGNLDRAGARARLGFASKFEEPREPTMLDRLQGIYTDDGMDRGLLGTLYLLAPPGVVDGPVGPDWEPMPWYAPLGCWNLLHDSPNLPPKGGTTTIHLFTGLAAGIGDAIVNAGLALQNDQAAIAAAAISVTNNKGSFWSM